MFIDIRVSAGFDRVFDQGLTTGCVDLVKGVNRVVGSVFKVMAQVDLGLTTASRFDSADSVISVNDAN
jgi:hypothetical protein